ncbi:MAG: CpsD/CapB family tyrosine-protein kinase [Armatimonadetes bacterium]|nr:CpsD/CapB family tyrosine-protein kinase [Armatimonadota bacterium]
MLRSNEVLLGQDPPHSNYLEAYRRLRTTVFALRDETPFRSLLITSAAPNEGKSVISMNISLLIAQAGFRVILVDGDFAHPGVHLEWELREAPGITDACLTNMDPEAIIQPTELDTLRVVTAGAAASRGPDLASSPQMPAIMQALAERCDLLIADSAPVLGSAGTLQLARMVDCVVLVARARGNVAPVRRALKLLKDVGRDPRGIIVNDILDQDTPAHSYYYYGSNPKTL